MFQDQEMREGILLGVEPGQQEFPVPSPSPTEMCPLYLWAGQLCLVPGSKG